jgi:hypothetical protein
MTDYLPLLKNLAQEIQLDDEIEAFQTLAVLANNWRQLAKSEPFRDVSSVELLVDTFAQQIDSGEIEEAFTIAGLKDAYAPARAVIDKMKDLTDRIPAEYKRLLTSVSVFDETAVWRDPGLVEWKLDGNRKLQLSDKWSLNLSAVAALQFEAGDCWPFTVDTMPDPLLRLGIRGQIGASAGAVIPYGFATLGIAAKASADAQLRYFYDVRGSDQLYAIALVDRLKALPDPFDYEAVWDAFAAGELAGIVYDFGGAASVNVEVGLAHDLGFGELINLQLCGSVSVAVSTSSNYTLSFRPGPPSSTGGKILLATLSRGELDTSASGFSLGINVDLAAIASQVHDLLTRLLEKWKEGLARIEPFLKPGTYLQNLGENAIGKAAEKLVGSAELRDALQRDLNGLIGIDPRGIPETGEWLANQIRGALDRGSAAVVQEADTRADRVLAVLARAGLPTFGEKAIIDQLKPELDKLIGRVADDLRARVDQIATDDLLDPLGSMLKDIGVRSSKTLKNADDAFAGVRTLIERFDRLLNDIVDATGDEARARISARVLVEERRTHDISYQVVGRFPSRTGGEEAFNDLVLGKLDGFVARIDGAPANGFEIDSARSSIRRFSRSEAKYGYEIVLLGFRASAEEVLSGEATAWTDGTGTVKIDARGRLEKRFSGPDEGREVSFTNVLGLAVAGSSKDEPVTRAIQFGLSVSHNDKSLDRGETEGFVGSFAEGGLIPHDTIALSRSVFQRWAGQGSSNRLRADIVARLWFDDDAPLRILRVERPDSIPFTDAEIITRGIEALNGSGAFRLKTLEADARFTASSYWSGHEHAPVVDIVRQINPKLLAMRYAGPRPRPRNLQLDRFAEAQAMLLDLVQLISTMRALYLSRPGDGSPGATSDEQYYRKKERQVAEGTGSWLKTNRKFIFWARREAAPKTIALFTVFAALAGLDNAARSSSVSITMTNRANPEKPETIVLC